MNQQKSIHIFSDMRILKYQTYRKYQKSQNVQYVENKNHRSKI